MSAAIASIPIAVLLLAGTAALWPACAAVGPNGDSGLLKRTPPASQPTPIPRTIPNGTQDGPDRSLLNAALAATMAASTFASLAKDAATSGVVPDHSDPRAASLLSTVFGVDRVRSQVTPGRADLPSLLAWLGAVDSVTTIYVFAGTGFAGPSATSNDPKTVAATNRNTAVYAVEIGQSIDASLALSAMMSTAAAGAIADITATDAGRTGLDELRTGITGAVTDAVATLTAAGLDADWQRARLTALLAAAPDLAKLLLPDQCSAIRAAADRTGQAIADRAIASGFQSFDAALAC